MRKNCLIIGPASSRSGYGAHTRDIIKSLLAMDRYNIQVIPTNWGSTPNDSLDINDPEDLKLINLFIPPQNVKTKPDLFIQVSIPNEFAPNGIKNIGITAGIETTTTKREWIEGLNRMDANIVTSQHSKNVFDLATFEDKDRTTKQVIGHITSKKPMFVLFEGIDSKIYGKGLPAIEDVKGLLQIPEQFAFLFQGAWLQGMLGQDRKDVSGLVKTFLDTFKTKADRNKPALIMKTSGAGFSETELSVILQKIEQIKNTCGEPTGKWPNIYILHGDLTDQEMNTLYNHSKIKAMISFTKGEGFGRPLLEFTMTGKPVIASNWSGQVDFLNPDYSVLLPGKVDKVHPSACNEWILKDSSWFTVDYGYASKVMNDVVENYDNYLEKSKKHINYTKENFSFEKMTEKFEEILDQIIPKEEPIQEFVLPELNLPKIK